MSNLQGSIAQRVACEGVLLVPEFDEIVSIRDRRGTVRIELEPETSRIRVYDDAGNLLAEAKENNQKGSLILRQGGELILRDSSNRQAVHLQATTAGFVLGNEGNGGDIFLYSETGEQTVHVSGNEGDIVLRNADAAEEFSVVNAERVSPGSVLVASDDEQLRVADTAYDGRVVGVVSGACSYKPAIILDRQPDSEERLPVALAGKVFVKAIATSCPIAVGDLLTTSEVPGHAMKAVDPTMSFGATIGKALQPLDSGVGLVPMLVSLQ